MLPIKVGMLCGRVCQVGRSGHTAALEEASVRVTLSAIGVFLWAIALGASAAEAADPSPRDIQAALDAAYEKYSGLQHGASADYISGKWLNAICLPDKSGVWGGIIAVSPERFGIALIAPPLDAAGNSVRAQKAIADVSNALGGNPYAVAPR
jgi:hypothetical protein